VLVVAGEGSSLGGTELLLSFPGNGRTKKEINKRNAEERGSDYELNRSGWGVPESDAWHSYSIPEGV